MSALVKIEGHNIFILGMMMRVRVSIGGLLAYASLMVHFFARTIEFEGDHSQEAANFNKINNTNNHINDGGSWKGCSKPCAILSFNMSPAGIGNQYSNMYRNFYMILGDAASSHPGLSRDLMAMGFMAK